MSTNEPMIDLALSEMQKIALELDKFTKEQERLKHMELMKALQFAFPVEKKTESEKFRRGQEMRKKFNPHV